MKLLRLRQWWEIVRLEQQRGHPIPWFKMLRAVAEGPVPRRVWFHRMYVCYRCPVHNRIMFRRWHGELPYMAWAGMHQCLTAHWLSDVSAGCGCHTPFKALSSRPYEHGCWGYTLSVDHPEVGPLGWPAHTWGSLRQQARDLIGHFWRR